MENTIKINRNSTNFGERYLEFILKNNENPVKEKQARVTTKC